MRDPGVALPSAGMLLVSPASGSSGEGLLQRECHASETYVETLLGLQRPAIAGEIAVGLRV